MTDNSTLSFDAVTAPTAEGWSSSTWMAVVSMAAATFALVSAEFLPAGLLTPMAADLGISEGTAGQVVTVTAVVGAVAALFANVAIGRLDRKAVLVGLSALGLVSNVLAAIATDFWVVLVARAGLGVALSGFWSLAAAIVARLVGVGALGRGMSIIFVGVSLATIAAPSVGAVLSDWLGWRAAMFAASGAALLAVLLQLVCLPRLPASQSNSLGGMLSLVGRPRVLVGMIAVLLFVTGHFAGFVYIRPFLEQVPVLPAATVAMALLGYGVASVIGNMAGGRLADANVRVSVIFTGLVLATATLLLFWLGASATVALGLVAVWGFAFGGAPIVLQTNLSRGALDELESAGSLMVVCFQLAIAGGAAIGGVIVDNSSVSYVLLLAGGLALLTALLGVLQPRD